MRGRVERGGGMKGGLETGKRGEGSRDGDKGYPSYLPISNTPPQNYNTFSVEF